MALQVVNAGNEEVADLSVDVLEAALETGAVCSLSFFEGMSMNSLIWAKIKSPQGSTII